MALLRGADKAAATELANKLREALKAERFISGEGKNLQITASFGLATYPEDGNTLHSIIRSADTMMYKAKADGRDCLAVADPEKPQAFVSPKSSRHT